MERMKKVPTKTLSSFTQNIVLDIKQLRQISKEVLRK